MHPRSSRLRLWFVLACLIVLSGCRKSSSLAATPETSEASQPAVPQQAPDTRPVIVAFGDSLTAGYGTDTGNSYPDFLEQDLNAEGYAYRVVNAGISGNTTKDGVERIGDVLALKPVLVIVAFGGNDGLRGLPIDSTRHNLDQIVSALQQAGIKVVLGGITLPPNYGPDYTRQFNQTYATIAREHHAPLLPFLLKDVYGVPGSMQPDGIHATAQGNRQVARNLLPLIKPFLHKQ